MYFRVEFRVVQLTIARFQKSFLSCFTLSNWISGIGQNFWCYLMSVNSKTVVFSESHMLSKFLAKIGLFLQVFFVAASKNEIQCLIEIKVRAVRPTVTSAGFGRIGLSCVFFQPSETTVQKLFPKTGFEAFP